MAIYADPHGDRREGRLIDFDDPALDLHGRLFMAMNDLIGQNPVDREGPVGRPANISRSGLERRRPRRYFGPHRRPG
ncbi:MAG: hypothetical protein M0C28_14905 [Candidatus Moduliflexus flocculans]|nr:hypothetical protein [Candidatus Moduliflexus flocculans]